MNGLLKITKSMFGITLGCKTFKIKNSLRKLQFATLNFQPIAQTTPELSKLLLTPPEFSFALTLDPFGSFNAQNDTVLGLGGC